MHCFRLHITAISHQLSVEVAIRRKYLAGLFVVQGCPEAQIEVVNEIRTKQPISTHRLVCLYFALSGIELLDRPLHPLRAQDGHHVLQFVVFILVSLCCFDTNACSPFCPAQNQSTPHDTGCSDLVFKTPTKLGWSNDRFVSDIYSSFVKFDGLLLPPQWSSHLVQSKNYLKKLRDLCYCGDVRLCLDIPFNVCFFFFSVVHL